jgi:hypothetical protein
MAAITVREQQDEPTADSVDQKQFMLRRQTNKKKDRGKMKDHSLKVTCGDATMLYATSHYCAYIVK